MSGRMRPRFQVSDANPPVGAHGDLYFNKDGTVFSTTNEGIPVRQARYDDLVFRTNEILASSIIQEKFNASNIDDVFLKITTASYLNFCANVNIDSIEASLGKNNEDLIFDIGRQLAMYAWYKGTTKSNKFTALSKSNTLQEALDDINSRNELKNDMHIRRLLNSTDYPYSQSKNPNIINTFPLLNGQDTSSGMLTVTSNRNPISVYTIFDPNTGFNPANQARISINFRLVPGTVFMGDFIYFKLLASESSVLHVDDLYINCYNATTGQLEDIPIVETTGRYVKGRLQSGNKYTTLLVSFVEDSVGDFYLELV